jgi:hypothetical protein
MKQLLIAAYILMVLMISGMAKAAPVRIGDGAVSRVEVSQGEGLLRLQGNLPNPCYTKPVIVVNGINLISREVEFDVIAQQISEICTQELGDDFEVIFDLKQLPLEEGNTYTLKFTGFNSVAAYVAHKQQQEYALDKQNFKGVLVVLSNPVKGSIIAIKKGNEMVPVYSASNWNLENYRNQEVRISGYAVESGLIPSAVSVIR